MSHIVLYTDGGSRGNPGAAGSGLHGYEFSLEKPKQGTGNDKYILTQSGYLTAEEVANAHAIKSFKNRKELLELIDRESPYLPVDVTVEHYFDAIYSFGRLASNNEAELQAAICGLKLAIDRKAESLLLYTDSEYVVKGVNEYRETWIARGFIKSDGQPIRNVELWRELFSLYATLNGQAKVSIQWIKGHEGHLGNETADKLATIALSIAASKTIVTGNDSYKCTVSDAKGYWKDDYDRPDLLFNRYILTMASENTHRNAYFTYNSKEPLLFLGKKFSDCGFCLVEYNDEFQPEIAEVIEETITRQAESVDKLPVMFAVDTNELINKKLLRDYALVGKECLIDAGAPKHELWTADRTKDRKQITHLLQPPHLSYKVLEVRDALAEFFAGYVEDNKDYVRTDLTSLFYNEKNELLKEVKVGTNKVKVVANFDSMLEAGILETEVILLLGQDLPDRNTLKRLEKKNTTLTLLTKAEAAGVFSYAVMLDSDQGRVLSTGYYSSVRILSAGELQKSLTRGK